jgi:L-malate glycosyltransferase
MSAVLNEGRRLPRIAWCSSTVFPPVYRHLGRDAAIQCPWKVELLEHAKAAFEAEWMVVAQGRTELACDFVADGVRHVVIGQPRRLHHWTYDWTGFDVAGRLLAAWKPDLVHVHGSENYFGLLTARGIVPCPGLIAMQGLLNPYVRTVWGPFGLGRVLRVERFIEMIRGTGLLGLSRQWRLGAKLEMEILRGNRWFAGRTAWDRANLQARNPAAKYRMLNELLRPEFAAARWSLDKANRHSIFFGNLVGPHKGGDVLLEAMRILKRSVPDVRLRIAGSMSPNGGYARHLVGAIKHANLRENFEFVGYIDAARMAQELARAHVFASASFMDNSPNAVGEAMMVGVPCVCSYVGGLPSLGRDGEEMLFFPPGDPEALAAAIAAIFKNDDLARKLSMAATKKARVLHDPTATMRQLAGIYSEMLESRLTPRFHQRAPLSSNPAGVDSR